MKRKNINQIILNSDIPISLKSEVDARYDTEIQFIQAVTNGDKEKILQSPNDDSIFLHRMPNNPLRVLKNLLIGLNTKCRLAAYQGGVPPIYLSILSEKYAIKIEQIKNKDEIRLVRNSMISEYCDAVKGFSTLNYSPLIKQAISYINMNLLDEVKLNEISIALHCHPAHLSRQFKKETNTTITSYINMERISTALFYFQSGKTNITEVAHLVGFNDSNYFCRVFKKFNGLTPSEYLKTLPPHTS